MPVFVCVYVFLCLILRHKKKEKIKSSKMADIENPAENPDHFAEEIVETGVIRKTVRKSYIIQEVSITKCYVYMI